jgi:hypothetical protein
LTSKNVHLTILTWFKQRRNEFRFVKKNGEGSPNGTYILGKGSFETMGLILEAHPMFKQIHDAFISWKN